MSKLLTLTENGYVRKYTSESEVNSVKITASKINLLPYDVYSKFGKPNNLDRNVTNNYGSYHFDFTGGTDYLNGRRLLLLDKLYDYVDLDPGTYTICMRVTNIQGTYNLGNLSCYRYYRNVSTGADISENMGTLAITPGVSDMLYSFVFTVLEGQLTYQFCLGMDFLTWSTAARDLTFDFEFIGLFHGEVSVDRQSNSFGDKPEMYIDNNENILGEYQINTDVLRHIKQIERHLIAHNNECKINFR